MSHKRKICLDKTKSKFFYHTQQAMFFEIIIFQWKQSLGTFVMDRKFVKRIRFLDTVILSVPNFFMFKEGEDLWAITRTLHKK